MKKKSELEGDGDLDRFEPVLKLIEVVRRVAKGLLLDLDLAVGDPGGRKAELLSFVEEGCDEVGGGKLKPHRTAEGSDSKVILIVGGEFAWFGFGEGVLLEGGRGGEA